LWVRAPPPPSSSSGVQVHCGERLSQPGGGGVSRLASGAFGDRAPCVHAHRRQVVAYFAPQFAELRRKCVAGGEAAFRASLSRCRRWESRGGKSSAYFAKTRDDRFVVKQLSKSEKQSFLEIAPAYFKYLGTAIQRKQDTCLAKILGVYQVGP
jgi:1-phosphatidylinositol-3-phosphate 5-kinase